MRHCKQCKKPMPLPDGVSDLLKKALRKCKICGSCAAKNLHKAIDEWQKVMDINTRGVFLTCQAVGRVMIKQRSGRIINLSSVRDRYGLPTDYAAYCPSKGAVSALTITLACEWAKHNVLVNAVAPTIVETALTRDALQNPDYAKMMKARIPLGRWAMPEDVAKPVVFLASKAADFITGQIIYIDGGVTTW